MKKILSCIIVASCFVGVASLTIGDGPRIVILSRAMLAPDVLTAEAASKNVAAIQAAYDSVRSSVALSGASGMVRLPYGDYWIDRPINMDAAHVGIEGAGQGITRLRVLTGHDGIITGFARRPAALPIGVSADHFADWTDNPNLAPSVNGRGKRYGFRTKADAHLAQQGGPLDAYMSGINALTIDMMIDTARMRDPGGSYLGGNAMSLCGLSERGIPSPWAMYISQNSYLFSMRGASGKTMQFSFGRIPDPGGLQRVTIQVDLTRKRILTWIDDKSVDNGARIPDDFGSTFIANEHCPFQVGATSPMVTSVTDYFGGASDVTIYGLRVSTAPLYIDDNAPADVDGLPLRRIDNQALSLSRYFEPGANVLGYLPFDDDPNIVDSSRIMSACSGFGARTTLYCVSNAGHGTNWSSVTPGPIRDLSIVGATGWGRGIANGLTLGLDVRRCEIYGKRDGIGSLNSGANYPATVMDCSIGGNDTPLHFDYASALRIQRIDIIGQFRTCIRLVDCNGVRITDLFAPAWGSGDYYMWARGSSFVMEDCGFDNEGNGGAQIAPIYVSPGPEFPTISSVIRCGFATYGVGAPLVILDDDNRSKYPCKFTIRDCADVMRGDLGSGRVDVKSKRWTIQSDLPK